MTSEEKRSLKEANLADKMKQYELETKLVPRTPIIARLVGNSFHRVCRNLTNDWKVIVQTALDSYVIEK